MNKKIFLHLFAASVLALSATSCQKWLDLKPQDGIVKDEYWQTKEQVQSAVMGCYATLLGDPGGKDKPLSEYLFLWGELRADMLFPGLKISIDEQDIMNVNTLPSNNIIKWSSVYRTINYCNTVIDFAHEVLKTDNTFTQAKLNSYLAEAKALRALMYFYLVRSFRDVPLKLKATVGDKDVEQLPKSPADVVLKQIEADLAFAENNAAYAYGSLPQDKGRITRYAVKAIQADVYLWQEKYQECLDACNFIIDSRKFGLVAGNSGWFNNLYYNGNSNEAIFSFQYDIQKTNSFHPMMLGSSQRLQASPAVMEEIFTQDLEDDTKRDIRGDGASVNSGSNAIWKYVGANYTDARTADVSYAHWPVYRYAQTLLDKAEALNQLNRSEEAYELVTTIRNRARALDASFSGSIDTTNKAGAEFKKGMTDFILEERAREFAFEGKRWYDILRNAKRNNYERKDLLQKMVIRAVPAIRQESAMQKYNDPDSYYFPIPLNEIETAPYLVQNPFYK
ncbi:RagB/SusD family nutrient uptake outer membrane protein [Paraflavisolibacter sp. H34]|uniref:RagB/SusD family nutrient uptake outer membrane protein n=1 Tax=Huijunlia imazamoxiresistens TaxID=3127457 RepID=UPI00301623A6